jgi:hypothetical protein
MALQSYTEISRTLGITIPALKRILSDAGYLEGKVPTRKAEEESIFEMRPLSSAFPGAGEFPLWDEDQVFDLVKAAGMDGNIGNGIWNVHAAGNQLHKAAQMAERVPGPRTAEVEAAMAWCSYEAVEVIHSYQTAGRRASGGFVKAKVSPLMDYLRSRKKEASAQDALRKIEAVLAWFASGRP